MPSWMTSFNPIAFSCLNLKCITISRGCTKGRKYTDSISIAETSFLFSYAALDVTHKVVLFASLILIFKAVVA